MALKGIAVYTLSAGIAAVIACAVWLAARRVRRRGRPGKLTRRDVLWLMLCGYLAAVAQIIGLRIGLVRMRPLSQAPHLVPLKTTLGLSPGMLAYHTLGNLAWFMPLGLLLEALWPKRSWVHAPLAGAALSAMVEAAQWLLGTGTPDIDDVLLNTLGALLGWFIGRLIRHARRT